MGLVYLFRPFILHVVFGRITEEVMANCSTYLLIVAASIPFIALYNAGAAVFRSMGDSRTAMYMSLIMNGINLVGNAILTSVWTWASPEQPFRRWFPELSQQS